MNLLSRFRLSMRLAAGFGLVLALLAGITAMAQFGLYQLEQNLREIVEVGNRRTSVAHDMMNAANDSFVALYGLLLATDDVDVKTQSDLYVAAIAQYDQARKSYAGMAQETEAKAQLQALDSAAQPSRSLNDSVLRSAAMGGNINAAFNATDPQVAQREWRREIIKLLQMEAQSGAALYEHATREYRIAQGALFGAAALAMLIGLAAVVVILRSVTRPLREAVEHARRIATGDLSGQIEASARDETGELLAALKQMQEQLRGLIRGIRGATDGITSAAGDIAQGNLALSERTEMTASNLEQAASSMEELTGTVSQSADSSAQARHMAEDAAQVAHDGGTVVADVVATMNDISENSRHIGDIISVIDGIAFQTNILALNAAVEAARAGEQGRGFAVVAAEVRNLAHRSAAAAKEIAALIHTSVDKVQAGTRLVNTAGQRMHDIVDAVQRVAGIIGEISSAAQEQSSGITQVNGAVSELDRMTQENAALVEESAAAAESLKDQAAQLSGLVNRFRLEAAAQEYYLQA